MVVEEESSAELLRNRRRLQRANARKLVAELRDLLCSWDPIGVMGLPQCPRDEYDYLLGPLYGLLSQGASPDEITAFLEQELRDHFGLDPTLRQPAGFAARLVDWFEHR